MILNIRLFIGSLNRKNLVSFICCVVFCTSYNTVQRNVASHIKPLV